MLFPAEWMCTVDNCVWCHKAQIGGGFSQRPCSAFMTLCNAQCLHLFIVILHCADFMAAAATCPVMFSTFSIPHPVAWQNRGCMVCRQPACGYEGFVSTHSNVKEWKFFKTASFHFLDYKENSKIFNLLLTLHWKLYRTPLCTVRLYPLASETNQTCAERGRTFLLMSNWL